MSLHTLLSTDDHSEATQTDYMSKSDMCHVRHLESPFDLFIDAIDTLLTDCPDTLDPLCRIVAARWAGLMSDVRDAIRAAGKLYADSCKHEDKISSLEDDIESLKSRHEDELDHKDSEIENLEDDIGSLNEQIQDVRDELASVELERDELSTKVDELESELDDLRTRLAERDNG